MTRKAALLALVVGLGLGCTPKVEVATSEPIVIDVNVTIAHELRVKLDDDIRALALAEEDPSQVAGRSLDFPISPQQAGLLKRAKQDGRVGERSNGYVGIVPGRGGAGELSLTERVNQLRQGQYQGLASRYQAPLGDVERVAGARRLKLLGPGQMYQIQGDAWKRLPLPGD